MSEDPNNIGLVLYRKGRWQEAADSFEEALAIFRATGFSPGEGKVLHNLGAVHLARGEHDRALELLQQALTFWLRTGNRQEEARTRGVLARAQEKMGQRSAAREEVLRALTLQREIHDRIGEAESLLIQARILRAQEEPGTAVTPIRESLDILEKVRADLGRDRLRSAFLSRRQDFYAFHVDLLMELDRRDPSAGHAAAALQASERARARNLLDMLASAVEGLHRGADPELLRRQRDVQQDLNFQEREHQRLLRQKAPAGQVAAAETVLESLLEELDGIRAEIRVRSPRHAALSQPSPLSAAEIQALLDPGTLLVSYFLAEERSFVWAVTRKSLHAFELPSRGQIEREARELHRILAQSDQRLAWRAAERASARLGAMILGPVASLLRRNRLVIVADGALQYIPFGVLAVEESAPYTPLIARHEILSLPSASVLATLRDTAAPAPDPGIAILADPVFQQEDPRVRRGKTAESWSESKATELPAIHRAVEDLGLDTFRRLLFSRREAESIARLFPPGEVFLALDFAANKEIATEGLLSRYRILHLATHGLLNTSRPDLSGLVLSLVDPQGRPKDGFLRLHEIYNLDLRSDLVVLSGCETALGQEVQGEGLIALTRGFMHAGVPAVVASLWKVDDRSTGELMRRFYEGMLEGGLAAPAALRAAQIALWSNRSTASPYHWAGFVYQGDWRRRSP